ncbi:hypothetical protein Hanom_Chr15g01362941 [Helianthus anomalus]
MSSARVVELRLGLFTPLDQKENNKGYTCLFECPVVSVSFARSAPLTSVSFDTEEAFSSNGIKFSTSFSFKTGSATTLEVGKSSFVASSLITTDCSSTTTGLSSTTKSFFFLFCMSSNTCDTSSNNVSTGLTGSTSGEIFSGTDSTGGTDSTTTTFFSTTRDSSSELALELELLT